jgi:hypothetical protein
MKKKILGYVFLALLAALLLFVVVMKWKAILLGTAILMGAILLFSGLMYLLVKAFISGNKKKE